MIDQTSLAILETLQSDARISNAELGRRVGLAPSAVFERIKKLEERGAVRGYSANVDPTAVDLGLLAFVLVRSDERRGAPLTEAALPGFPGSFASVANSERTDVPRSNQSGSTSCPLLLLDGSLTLSIFDEGTCGRRRPVRGAQGSGNRYH